MCENKVKSEVLKLSDEDLQNIIASDLINNIRKFIQDIESNGDTNAFTKKLKFICDSNDIIHEINLLEKHDTEHKFKKLTEIKSYFISAMERCVKNLNEIIDSMDKDLALTLLEKMKNLYASNNKIWPSKEKVEAKLGINYVDFMKNKVDNFLEELDNVGVLDNFIRLLCACIFQEESEALRYASAFKTPPIKFRNLIKDVNSNLQNASFDFQWPSKSDVEDTLNMTYNECCLAVEKILKVVNNIRKGAFICYLIACIFHDDKKADYFFIIVILSGLDLSKLFGKILEEKGKEFEEIVKNKKN